MAIALKNSSHTSPETTILTSDLVLPRHETLLQGRGQAVPLVKRFPFLFQEIHLPGFLGKIKIELLAACSILSLLGANALNLSRCTLSETANIESNFSQIYTEQKARLEQIAMFDGQIEKLEARKKYDIVFEVMKERAGVASHYNTISEVSKFAFSDPLLVPKEGKPLPRSVEIPTNQEFFSMAKRLNPTQPAEYITQK